MGGGRGDASEIFLVNEQGALTKAQDKVESKEKMKNENDQFESNEQRALTAEAGRGCRQD